MIWSCTLKPRQICMPVALMSKSHWSRETFLTSEGIRYSRKGIYDLLKHIRLTKGKIWAFGVFHLLISRQKISRPRSAIRTLIAVAGELFSLTGVLFRLTGELCRLTEVLCRLTGVLFNCRSCYINSLRYKSRYTRCRTHQNSLYSGNSEVFSHINKDLILLTAIFKK